MQLYNWCKDMKVVARAGQYTWRRKNRLMGLTEGIL